MPELPEVEIVTLALDNLLEGRRIVSAGLYREKLAPHVPPQEFESIFNETAVKNVRRRGKHILIGLANGMTLIVHLRMSGRFQVLRPTHENPKFTHAEFILDDDSRLVFSDQRHFGFMNVAETRYLHKAKELSKLAPEPLTGLFSKTYLKNILATSRRRIKELLLDQEKVCGLGNIYVAEALFMSRIHPEKPANTVSSIKSNRLRDNIRFVLQRSIDHGSTLKIDPLNLDSRYYGGDFEGEFQVYDREKQPCFSCGNLIRRIVQGGRSSYFCPRCQRK